MQPEKIRENNRMNNGKRYIGNFRIIFMDYCTCYINVSVCIGNYNTFGSLCIHAEGDINSEPGKEKYHVSSLIEMHVL
jgi:hypothetical protein